MFLLSWPTLQATQVLTQRQKLEKAEQEKDDLKLKLEKFETSSNNLAKLIGSQLDANNKTGLGYGNHVNRCKANDSKSVSDEEDSPVNDRFKKSNGNHAVPPSYTRNYMPPRADLSFAGLDDSVYKCKTSNTLHNAIMETGGKDRQPMLEPGKYVQWKSRIKRYIDTKPNHELIHYCLKNLPYKYTWADKVVPISEGSSETTTERSQQVATRNRGKTIVNSPPSIYDQEPSMVAEDDEMSKDKEIDKLMALISLSFKKIYKPTNNNLQTPSNTSRANQDNSPRINRSTGYDNQRIGNVVRARETVGTTVVQKSRIQCYNCKEFRHVVRECQKPKWAKESPYHKEKMLSYKKEEAGFQLSAEQADWRDGTDDEPEDQELEAHYMYMAQIQEVTPDAVDNSGPIFDTEPLQKLPNNDHYNEFSIESEHPEQSKFVNDTYPIEQDEHNVIIDSLDMSYDRQHIDQNDDDDDLANEHDLLASLIEKLKCEIDDSINRNKFLETSNKTLVDKLKGEIADFKTKNKSLESSNNHLKEGNNELSKTNELMYNDLKKLQAELNRRNDVKYASNVEIECAKAKGDLISYKMESQKSFNKYS
nr:hypothetical protein [Tanacetum cinerariifolium]